jgi:diguanylate cyclase (GGDEF)-like protein
MRSKLFSRKLAFIVTLAYFAAGFLWITLSDLVVATLHLPETERTLVEIVKGDIFIALSSLAVYFVIHRLIRISNETSAQKHLARQDPLTHLLNRSGWTEASITALRRQERGEATVVLIDVSQLRYINGAFGMAAGDFILRYVADHIRHHLGPHDILGRNDASRFALFLPGNPEQDIERLFEDLSRTSHHPVQLGLHRFRFSFAMGISRAPRDATSILELLTLATIALDQAKLYPDRHLAYYNPTEAKNTLAALRLETDLGLALERHEFIVHFQPILSLPGLQLLSVESLVRWQHPALGLIPPDTFIRTAERIGLIHELGRFVLTESIRNLMRLQIPALVRPSLAINLSALQFAHRDLLQSIEDTLEETGFPPDRLSVEITESTFMNDPEQGRKILNRLHEMGISSALDDFGTGYSSLAYLQELPVQALKIDRSLIKPLPSQEPSRRIVRALIDLAHSLELRVIAEGIERREELEALENAGCDAVQGFLFSRPLPPSALSEWILNQNDNLEGSA